MECIYPQGGELWKYYFDCGGPIRLFGSIASDRPILQQVKDTFLSIYIFLILSILIRIYYYHYNKYLEVLPPIHRFSGRFKTLNIILNLLLSNFYLFNLCEDFYTLVSILKFSIYS